MARSCFILGCGRSGTSLTAGLFARVGYFMGDELYPPDEGNPRGYFEAREINAINEGLLAQILPAPRRSLVDKLMKRAKPATQWYRWLGELDVNQQIPLDNRLATRIETQVARRPFCFKDPRFCYTLDAWRKLAPEAAIVCAFRHPEASASSIEREAARSKIRLDGIAVSHERALRIWRATYRYVLDVHLPAGGDWLFVHYEQLIDGSLYRRLEELTAAKINRDFADPKLRRSLTPGTIRPEDAELYQRLCELADFDDNQIQCASQQ
jgi:sulfotransferase family protein